MSSRAGPRVAVVMGGPSSEREVSLSTGRGCADALRGEGYDVTEVDAGPDLAQRLADLSPDVAFNALHGRWGEDGCVQGLFEWMRLPYTHSGVLASARAMDKQLSKSDFAAAGIPISEGILLPRSDIAGRHPMAPPYVVKPNAEGSSVGVTLVMPGDPPPALAENLPAILMVERFVPGRELTTSVMGGRALGVTEIVTDDWYDYDAKYKVGGSRHVLPADIPDGIAAACADLALRAHAVLGCRGVTRTDFRWDDSRGADGLAVLELNTQPGMTPTSLTPEQADHDGIGFAGLCAWLVEEASCDR